MIHPLLRLMATQPQLLAEHAQAYAELAADQADEAAQAWKRQALWLAAAFCALLVAVILAGVALLLCAVTPLAQMPAPWALVAVPLPAAALALYCGWAARASTGSPVFGKLREQLRADMAMLSELNPP